MVGGNKRLNKPSQPMVAIPGLWAREHGLMKGDYMLVYYDMNSKYLIVSIPDAAPIEEAVFIDRKR